MIQVIINWLFDNKSVLFGALLPILLSPVVGFDCAGKNKIGELQVRSTGIRTLVVTGKNKNMKKKKQEETESENSKKKKKKRSKEDTSGDSVEDSAPMKKSVMKKSSPFKKLKNKKSKGPAIYKPPPLHERPKNPGFEAPIEPTEDTNTYRQIEGFRDAQNFA
ncbi:hypothetical protein CRE_29427 [Caenorhabditis remanei]|uniref:Uncharacterized protein n=1 Tax=Caenorhabditis remanei TaxID=31234 RepID=E3LUY0_CAERE|nr:hypothetical protein CRE_29427 [Caenorhabditis remanei]